jgi:GntR family transcriptional regulator, transcriptional repressor for pyruvate dehydrogenase complex
MVTDATAKGQATNPFEAKPVVRPREQVEAQLRQAILSGASPRGSRLPSEAALADQFRVSRSTIREALRSLASSGLISKSTGANGGSYVEYFDHHDLADLVVDRVTSTLELGSITYVEVAQFRNLLEVPSARLAASNRSDEQLAGLHEIIDREKTTSADDPMVHTYNSEFHQLIADASGNRLLAAFVAGMHRITDPLAFIDTSPEVGRKAVEHHIAIYSALANSDPDLAAAAMADHLDYLQKHAI